jgi:two-component system response regulator AtoC
MLKAVLVIDDEGNMRHMLQALLTKQGYKVDVAANGAEGLEQLGKSGYDFVLCDLRMPGMDGMAFLEQAQKLHSATIIMMSAYGTIDQAIETVKKGAYDYISKPFKLDEILLVLRKAEERERLRRENRELKSHLEAIDGQRSFGGMVGRSKPMQEVFQLAGKVASYNTTVLITGESGTGKELVARGIHAAGKGDRAPFVAVNCGSVPEHLLESEFFGHVRGAFTGADKDKKGLFEEADQGTLFLERLGSCARPTGQAAAGFARAGSARVGSVKSRRIDVRVLAATNRDLGDLVRQNVFREDLFYRLNVLNVEIPPLRRHMEDLPFLCRYFLDMFDVRVGIEVQGIAPAAMELFMRYQWPGNVRELENVLERALILTDKNIILPEHLPEQFGSQPQCRRIDDLLGTYSLKEAKIIMEKRLIGRAMEATGGNKSKAAQLLELSYPALLGKLKEYQIDLMSCAVVDKTAGGIK